jgi:hypothetical protein
LFDKKEQERISIIKEQAFTKREVKADAPVVKQTPATKTSDNNPYITELQKYK